MNQIQDKVKDIVEVCSSPTLSDFAADPTQTLVGYHFTDITADLMAKWIDRVVALPSAGGNAFALAGYRGVGKSHFLAVFGAMLSLPELRTRSKDSHVYASAERLIRRHYPVVYVRRGTKAKLADELKSAVGQHFSVDTAGVGDSAADIVNFAVEKAGAGPTIFIIDTAIEREIRVARDDGNYLSEIAEAAAGKNVFIAVALDDDVAAADGRNSAIARSFTIDYLDHEHLYKIIDVHVFPKVGVKRKTIFEIFENFRRMLPGFRWSEQRFSSVYPLHPVILEVAPFVRLFVQDFALLSFASDAGAKILGRPADSLIALDELFDRVEKDLRRSSDLKDAFAAYEELSDKVINKIPVMERLKAKLVLKGLMMLSLDGEGATASDIAASMLIFDDREPQSAVNFVEDLLARLAAALPNGLWSLEREGRAAKYGFRLSGKEDFQSALAEAVRDVPESVVPGILMRLMRERFADCDFVDNGTGFQVVETDIEWRGAIRRGRVIWCIGHDKPLGSEVPASELEWEAILGFDDAAAGGREAVPSVHWRPDELKLEESETIRRYHALMSRTDLQETFRDQIRTAIQAQTIAIEKVLDRKFLQYGKLVVDGEELEFSPAACSGHTLSDVMSIMLAPYFERKFGEHPDFSAVLDMAAVDELASVFFAGGDASSTSESLARSFAVPLGLADIMDGKAVPVDAERLTAHPAISSLLDELRSAGESLPIVALEKCLGAAPHGLTQEAQRLILAALVGRGTVEFVTANGDRIGQRSLDLRIIWDDVAGIAFPAESGISADSLSQWAVLLTGKESLVSTGKRIDGKAVVSALSSWLDAWNEKNTFERFTSLSDELLTCGIWQVWTQCQKSFGTAVDAADSVVNGRIDVETGLKRIRDAFSASEDEFRLRSAELAQLEVAVIVEPLRQEILAEIAACDITDDARTEGLRNTLRNSIDAPVNDAVEIVELRELLDEFRDAYSEYFIACHDMASRANKAGDRAAELLRSDRWWIFENLASIPAMPQNFRHESRAILRELRMGNCGFNLAHVPGRVVSCTCGFSPALSQRQYQLPAQLSSVVDRGLSAFRAVIIGRNGQIAETLKNMLRGVNDPALAGLARELSSRLTADADLSSLNDAHVRLLRYLLAGPDHRPVQHDIVTEISSDAVMVAEEVHEEEAILHI